VVVQLVFCFFSFLSLSFGAVVVERKKKKSYETIGDDGIDPYYDDPDYAMDNDNYVSSTPKTDQARKEMNEKWGIGSRSLDEARAKLDQRDGYQA